MSNIDPSFFFLLVCSSFGSLLNKYIILNDNINEIIIGREFMVYTEDIDL